MVQHFVRKLTGKEGQEIEVSVGTPIQEDGANGDWRCTCRILGLGTSKTKIVTGIDGIQAFTLALKYVATTLYLSEEFERGEITWKGGMTVSDLGFPVFDAIREDVEKKKALVEERVLNAR